VLFSYHLFGLRSGLDLADGLMILLVIEYFLIICTSLILSLGKSLRTISRVVKQSRTWLRMGQILSAVLHIHHTRVRIIENDVTDKLMVVQCSENPHLRRAGSPGPRFSGTLTFCSSSS
jgi:hypothetical protein